MFSQTFKIYIELDLAICTLGVVEVGPILQKCEQSKISQFLLAGKSQG